MPQDSKIASHVIGNTSIPYVSYNDITSEKPIMIAGQNILTTAKQLMERRPGFSDALETSTTTFTSVKKLFVFSKWGGTRFIWIANNITASASDVYKYEVGVDTSFSKIFSSASTAQFSFVVSTDTLYMTNGTDQMAYDAVNTYSWAWPAMRKWGITRPSAAPTIGTSGTGTSTYARGWYYRVAYGNSLTGHESSASDLSACTGIFSNKQVDVTLVASPDPQVDTIYLYRTTDGGSTDPTVMRLVSSYANANATVADTTADASLTTRTSPGTTTNDRPPAMLQNIIFYGTRIWGSVNNQTWFSAFEELPANGRPEECWPSGISGNYYQWDAEVTGHAPMPDGVAAFTRGRIWKVEGDLRDNFRRYKIVERRGALNQNCIISMGNEVAWLDTANQVWTSEGEIGFDIRTDLDSIDHSKATLCVHVAGTQHWIMLLDGGSNRLFVYDIDTRQWMPPWTVPRGTLSLVSDEYAAGDVRLGTAISGTDVYLLNASSYTDAGATYIPKVTMNLMPITAKANPEWNGRFDYIALETGATTASVVSYLLDDDPTIAAFTPLTANAVPPQLRSQGQYLVKNLYKVEPVTGQRVSAYMEWPDDDIVFTLYTIEIGFHLWRA